MCLLLALAALLCGCAQQAGYAQITADDLAQLGYTNVREFGGIIDWPYETEPAQP